MMLFEELQLLKGTSKENLINFNIGSLFFLQEKKNKFVEIRRYHFLFLLLIIKGGGGK